MCSTDRRSHLRIADFVQPPLRSGPFRRIIAAAVATFLFSACASAPQPDPLLVEAANASVKCGDSKDCEVKWARAFDWVRHHSAWQINVASDSLIQTDGPMDLATPAFVVRRSPIGEKKYEIVLEVACADTFDAQTSCLPHVLEWKANFASIVNSGETSGTREYSRSIGL